jgi:hypothetical protein
MMSNAGGAWDNGKKLCEKLDIKKTEQGKACIVGDTVGDPFKDTSGPALNILIKLMSMVSLTIAPLIKGRKDFESFEYGFIPLAIFVLVTAILVVKGILSWKDPLGNIHNPNDGAEMMVQVGGGGGAGGGWFPDGARDTPKKPYVEIDHAAHIYQAPDGYKGTYAQVVAHEKANNLKCDHEHPPPQGKATFGQANPKAPVKGGAKGGAASASPIHTHTVAEEMAEVEKEQAANQKKQCKQS